MSGTNLVAVATTTRRSPTLRGNESAAQRLDLPKRLTLLAATLVVLLVVLILAFITWNGVQIFLHSHVELSNLPSSQWDPTATPAHFGILPFIAGTAGVTAVAAIISTPLSVG